MVTTFLRNKLAVSKYIMLFGDQCSGGWRQLKTPTDYSLLEQSTLHCLSRQRLEKKVQFRKKWARWPLAQTRSHFFICTCVLDNAKAGLISLELNFFQLRKHKLIFFYIYSITLSCLHFIYRNFILINIDR